MMIFVDATCQSQGYIEIEFFLAAMLVGRMLTTMFGKVTSAAALEGTCKSTAAD